MDRLTYDATIDPHDDPRAHPARVGRPHRALARPRRRPAAVRGHAAVRGLVHGRPAARIGRARRVDRRVLADPRLRGPRRDRGGRAALPRGASTTSTSTTGPAGSASGRCSRTRSTSRIASWRGLSRPGRASPTARLRTSSSPRGSCRSAGTSRLACRSVSGRMSRAGRTCRSSRRCGSGPTRRTRSRPRASAGGPNLTPLDWLRIGTLGGATALGLGDRIGSLEAGKEADLIVVDPSFAAPIPGVTDDEPDDLMSRLIFRVAPRHGPRRLGPRPPPRGIWSPRGMTVSDSVDLLIEGGTIVDGTGEPGRAGSVVVDGRAAADPGRE